MAAQTNRDIINTADIAKGVGVDDKSIVQYFSILEGTLLGFHLPAFQHSFRKRLLKKPKFYFIDTGITRALSRTLSLPVSEGTYEYGKSFEHLIILECYKLINYYFPDYRLSYLRDHHGLEIDLIIERPGLPLLMVEIKSTTDIKENHLKSLRKVADTLGKQAEYVCLARIPQPLQYDNITVYPWQTGICQILKLPLSGKDC